MAVARSEENGDVGGPRLARDAGCAIAHDRARQQPHDFIGDAIRRRLDGLGRNDAQRITAAAVVNGKPILLCIAEGIVARACGLVASDLVEQLVDERENLRRGSEADRDRLSWPALGPEPFDELRRFVDERDVGVAKAVDRLLAIAHDENRRRNGIVGGAESFTPALDELPDQLPLRAARVLEFVDEDVAVPRFEPQTALGELVEILEQLHRALEDAGEVDERMGIERALILTDRHREDPPDAPRHDDVEVAAESANGAGHERREPRGARAMTAPGVLGVAVGRLERRAGELLAARRAVLREEVRAQAIDEAAERRGVNGGLWNGDCGFIVDCRMIAN